MARKLTEEQRVKYLTVFMGDRCPYCEAKHSMDTVHPLRLTANWEAQLDIRCTKCGAGWRDVYRLHNVEDIEDEDPNKLDDESAGHTAEEADDGARGDDKEDSPSD